MSNFVKEFVEMSFLEGMTTEEINAVLNKQQDKIKQLEAKVAELESHEQWVSVNDEKPPNAYADVWDGWSRHTDVWIMPDGVAYSDLDGTHVIEYTHWRPLPLPPLQEKANE